ncbi:MAG TPA: PQQ-binding-like beta-propeller repeat protein [Ktedonobacterales bacterium]|nr:PQQ-binding-like beta-propeller repeat protein [Ktedonobacterales bacterium]
MAQCPLLSTACRARVGRVQNRWMRIPMLCAILCTAIMAGACRPAPSDAHGVVYVASSHGEILALRADDGAVAWKVETEGDPHCQPILANGLLYVDEPDVLHDTGVLYAVDTRTGAVRWKYTYQGVTSSLLLADGTLYAGAGSLTRHQGAIFAVRATDGAQVWIRPFAPYEPVLSAIRDGVVFGGTVDGAQLALRASDGGTVWHTASRGIASAPPTLAGDTLYVASDALLALKVNDGSLRWQRSQPEHLADHAPVVANGVVYVGSSAVYAYRAADGAPLWHASIGDGMNAPVVVGDVVYAGSEQHNSLVALDGGNGATIWAHRAGTGVTLPTVVDGTLYLGADTVSALRTQDGTSLWSHPVQPSVLAAPIARDGVVYAATAGNFDHPSHVLALRADDGALLWDYEVGPNLYYSPLLGPAV